MLAVIGSFLGAILVMGMDSAQSMYFFKHKKDGVAVQRSIVTSILQWRIFFGVICIIFGTLLSPLLNTYFFDGQLSLKYFVISFSGVLFSQILSQSIEVLRLLYRPWGYVLISLLQSLLAASLVLIFVLIFNYGIMGFILGSLCASMVVALIGWFQVRIYLDFSRIHFDWWPQLIRFGLPLLPSGVAFYFMSTSDRWFIQHYYGPEEIGLFAVGAKFSMMMSIAVETFRKAWWPVAMDSMHGSDGPKVFRMIARLYFGVGISFLVVLTLFSQWLVKMFTAEVYHQAWPIVCILFGQSLLYGFFLIASAGIWKAEKTYLNLYLMMIAVFFGFFLNWLFVPKYGGIGAAIATVLTYLIWNTISLIVSERLWRVNFSWIVMGVQIFTGIAFIAWFVSSRASFNSYITYSVGVLIAFLSLFSSFERSEIRKMRSFIRLN